MLLKTPVARAGGLPLPALLPAYEALARGDVPQNCSLLSTSGDACLLRCDADNSLRKAASGPITHIVDAAANCYFDRGGDVDFIPCHHLLESAFGFVAAALEASVKTVGSICHETPHLPLHQPQALSCPPLPTLAFQYLSALVLTLRLRSFELIVFWECP